MKTFVEIVIWFQQRLDERDAELDRQKARADRAERTLSFMQDRVRHLENQGAEISRQLFDARRTKVAEGVVDVR